MWQAALPVARVDVARGVTHLAEALALPRHEHAIIRAVRRHRHRRHAIWHAVSGRVEGRGVRAG
eukprot:scaffold57995_cov72-Phaeocystis_antarctica.AAC.3